MFIGTLPIGPGGADVPTYHTFTDLTTSSDKRQHVGSRFELFDLSGFDYCTYINIFKPEDLVYAGWHKRNAKDGDWYSGSVKEANHLWYLRDTYPPEDFLLMILSGHHSKDEVQVAEDELIKHLWDSVGKHKDGGKCLNLARNSHGFKGYDNTGERNPNFGRTGADHKDSKPVIELMTGRVFPGHEEAGRILGITRGTITNSVMRNARKIRDGKPLGVSDRRTNHLGKPNANYGTCWLDHGLFLAEIIAGRSVKA